MRKLSGLSAAMLTIVALTASPAIAQAQSDQATLNQFLAAVDSIRSSQPSVPNDVARAGSQCSSQIDALVRALPDTITSDVRCDVGNRGGIVVIGGASLR